MIFENHCAFFREGVERIDQYNKQCNKWTKTYTPITLMQNVLSTVSKVARYYTPCRDFVKEEESASKIVLNFPHIFKYTSFA